MKKIKDYLIGALQLLTAAGIILAAVFLVGLLSKVVWKIFLAGFELW